MCVTKPSLHNLIWKPLKATPFHLCAMRNTNSSFLGLIGTSLDFAFRYYSFFVCRNRSTIMIIIHLLLRLLLDDDAFADNSSSTAERHGYKLEETSIHSIFMHSTWRERSSRSLTYYEYLCIYLVTSTKGPKGGCVIETGAGYLVQVLQIISGRCKKCFYVRS